MGYDINKVINVASNEVGYFEKKTWDSNGYEKDKNVGKGKFTKYGNYFDYYSANEKFHHYYDGVVNGRAGSWSLIFVHWCFCQAYGFGNCAAMTYYKGNNWERVGAPKNDNKYYLTSGGNGYNRCIQGNSERSDHPRETTYSVLPNCVGYAHGRFLEYWQINGMSELPTCNAKNWYSQASYNGNNKFKCQKSPEIGSVIVFDDTRENGYGHVAFVERINPNGDLFLSESNWTGTYFKNRTVKKSEGYNLSSQLPLKGFVCLKNVPLERKSTFEGARQGYKNAGRFDKNPKVGDQIFFGTDEDIVHTGIVYKVDQDYVYTIEGYLAYGGSNPEYQNYKGVPCVGKAMRSRTDKRINGYGHPNYGSQPITTTKLPSTTTKTTTPKPVTLSSIAITQKPTKLTYEVGDTFNTEGMVVTATYSDNTTSTVDASSYTVAGFDSGTAGTKTITVTHQGKTANFTITVTPKAVTLSSIAVTKNPTKLTYEVGDTFSTSGMVITATYSDNTTATVAVSSCTITGFSSSTTGTKTVVVTYQGKTASFSVTVNPKPVTLSSIAVTKKPTKLTYEVGDTLDTTGMVVTATYSDNTTAIVAISNCTITGFSSSTAGTKTVTVAYQEKKTTFTVTVKQVDPGTITPTNSVGVLSGYSVNLKKISNTTDSNEFVVLYNYLLYDLGYCINALQQIEYNCCPRSYSQPIGNYDINIFSRFKDIIKKNSDLQTAEQPSGGDILKLLNFSSNCLNIGSSLCKTYKSETSNASEYLNSICREGYTLYQKQCHPETVDKIYEMYKVLGSRYYSYKSPKNDQYKWL